MDNIFDRHIAAKLARQLYDKQITYNQLLENYPDNTNDNEIEDLFDLIEHEPQKGGLLGVSEKEYQTYMQKINYLIKKLET